ncbi:MAG: DNA alkylation repair protein [Bacteroidales bacterium]
MVMQETIRGIKKKFRLAMNGDVSTAMRKSGLDYKLNFGVSLPTIKKIAAEYYPNKHLAEYLYNENVRESKIMATLLWKVEDFSKEKAAEWVAKADKLEIAEQAAMNLFAKLPYAKELALKWTVSIDPVERMNGHLLLVRLIIQGTEFSLEELKGSVSSFISDLQNQGTTLFSLSLNALKRIGKLGPEVRIYVLEQLTKEKDEKSKKIKQELETEYSYYD